MLSWNNQPKNFCCSLIVGKWLKRRREKKLPLGHCFRKPTLTTTNMEKAALELESKFDDTEKRLDKVQYIYYDYLLVKIISEKYRVFFLKTRSKHLRDRFGRQS